MNTTKTNPFPATTQLTCNECGEYGIVTGWAHTQGWEPVIEHRSTCGSFIMPVQNYELHPELENSDF